MLPAIAFIAERRAIDAQHCAQGHQLPWLRQGTMGSARMRERHWVGDRHGGYQLTARLTEAVRPAPVKRSSTVLLSSVPLGSAFQST